jgi:hypothetical protein
VCGGPLAAAERLRTTPATQKTRPRLNSVEASVSRLVRPDAHDAGGGRGVHGPYIPQALRQWLVPIGEKIKPSWRHRGVASGKAAAELNARGIVTPECAKWHATQVIRVRKRLGQWKPKPAKFGNEPKPTKLSLASYMHTIDRKAAAIGKPLFVSRDLPLHRSIWGSAMATVDDMRLHITLLLAEVRESPRQLPCPLDRRPQRGDRDNRRQAGRITHSHHPDTGRLWHLPARTRPCAYPITSPPPTT